MRVVVLNDVVQLRRLKDLVARLNASFATVPLRVEWSAVRQHVEGTMDDAGFGERVPTTPWPTKIGGSYSAQPPVFFQSFVVPVGGQFCWFTVIHQPHELEAEVVLGAVDLPPDVFGLSLGLLQKANYARDPAAEPFVRRELQRAYA